MNEFVCDGKKLPFDLSPASYRDGVPVPGDRIVLDDGERYVVKFREWSYGKVVFHCVMEDSE